MTITIPVNIDPKASSGSPWRVGTWRRLCRVSGRDCFSPDNRGNLGLRLSIILDYCP